MTQLRRPLVAGNWKMNQGGAGAPALAAAVCDATRGFHRVDVVVCPPFTAIAAVARQLQGTEVQVGAQDLYTEPHGAFTGEISASMLLEAGATWVIIGHSERRSLFGETDAMVALKTKVALEAGLRPIVCVGETLSQREQGKTLEVVHHQVNAFASIFADAPGVGAIAYEPVWAIGTGKTAVPADAEHVHAYMRDRLRDVSAELGDVTRILYGGSMNATNATGLIGCGEIDGGLIGGASLKPADFASICEAGQNSINFTLRPPAFPKRPAAHQERS